MSFHYPRAFNADVHQTRELRAERNYEAARAAAFMHNYPEQLDAYLELARAFDNRESAIFFVDGPGGSNKSFLFEAFLHYSRGRGEIAVACAWSSLAAALLPGGRACHVRIGFLVPLPREDMPSGGDGRFSLLGYGDPFPLLVCYLETHIVLLDFIWGILEQKPCEDPSLLPFDGGLSLLLISEVSFRRILILVREGTRFSFAFLMSC